MTDSRPLEGRIIPAGEPLPAAEPPLLPPPPPPTITAPPAPIPPQRRPAPGPPPTVYNVHVYLPNAPIDLSPIEAQPPRWRWGWLRRWARPRHTLTAAVVALTPFPPYLHSLASAWAATVAEARAESTPGAAYVIAGGVLAAVAIADARTELWRWRLALVIAAAGLYGAINPFDIVTITTGATR